VRPAAEAVVAPLVEDRSSTDPARFDRGGRQTLGETLILVGAPFALLALFVAQVALAFAGDAWFMAGSVAVVAGAVPVSVFVAKRNQSSAYRFPHALTVVALVLYGTLASILLVTVRAASGAMEWPLTPFQSFGLGVYVRTDFDATALANAVLQLLLAAASFTLVSLSALKWYGSKRERPVRVSALTAVFCCLLFFTSFSLPPYNVNLDHWFHFVAAGTGIRHGVWPYYSGFDSGYGWLGPVFVSAWLTLFGLSALSLSSLIMLSNMVAGGASFVLINRLTGSRLLALLGALYPLQALDERTLLITRSLAVNSSFRAPLQIALGGLLLYLSLRDRRGRVWPGFLFGLVVMWNPPFGLFMATGYTLAFAYLIWYAGREERFARVRTLLAMLAGVGLPVAVSWWLVGEQKASPAEIGAAFASMGNLFLLGFANRAQIFDPSALLAFAVTALYATAFARRLSRHQRLTTPYLFVGASLIAFMPYLPYAMGRSDGVHMMPAYWCLLPMAAPMAEILLRLYRVRPRVQTVWRSASAGAKLQVSAVLASLVLVAFQFGTFPIGRILSTHRFAQDFEGQRSVWAAECSREGQCDIASRPTLGREFRELLGSLLESKLLRIDPRIIDACRRNIPIFSYLDGWIYVLGDCFSPAGIPTIGLAVTTAQVDRVVALLRTQNAIIVYRGEPAPKVEKPEPEVVEVFNKKPTKVFPDLYETVTAKLVQDGYKQSPACHHVILSKGDVSELVRSLCE
jgi:hypothetical protein